MGFFGHVTTRRGTIFPSQQIFILSREGLAGTNPVSNCSVWRDLMCPAIGLSWPDMGPC